ncbi:putative RNA methyltransferase At5g51130, partial [Bienertia sinuspersici]
MAESTENSANKTSANVDNANNGTIKGKRKRKEVAPFGNYRNYYGRSTFQSIEEGLFEGKDCLDIGCNSGLITINIAKKFTCRTILGIDIDNDRINDAWWHLKKIVKKEKTRNGDIVASKSKVVRRLNELECSEACSISPKNDENGAFSDERDLLDVVSFRSENFVTSWRSLPLKHYDTIVCLSVTKWIHLNWGDKGLISFFAKIWRLLHPGGIFVLEPQPWESYYKNRLTTETTQRNYNYIVYKPELFQEILVDKIGFRT